MFHCFHLVMFENCFHGLCRLTIELFLGLYLPSCSIFSNRTSRLADTSLTFTNSKSTIEALEKGVKYIQS